MPLRSIAASNASRSFGSRRERRVDLPGRLAQPVLVADVHRESLVPERRHRQRLQLRVLLDRRQIGRLEPVDHVDVAGAQVRGARARLDDDLERQLVELDLRRVVVVRRALEHDRVALAAARVLERPDAHRVGGELLAELLELLGRHHHARAVGELRGQRRERRRELDLDRARVDDLDRADRRELGRAAGLLERAVAVERRLDGGGVELRAVVELDAVAELDRDGLAVTRDLRQRRRRAAGRSRGSRRGRRASRTCSRTRSGPRTCARASDRAGRGPPRARP